MMSGPMRPPPGLLLSGVGDHWAAYSPLSGESVVLNNEGAAILEVVAKAPNDIVGVSAILSHDVDLAVEHLTALIHPLWQQLIEAGLLEEVSDRP